MVKILKILRISRDVQFRHTSLISHVIRYANIYTRTWPLFDTKHTHETGKTTSHKCTFLHTQSKEFCVRLVVYVCIYKRRKRTWRTMRTYKYTRSSIALSSANKRKEHAAPLYMQKYSIIHSCLAKCLTRLNIPRYPRRDYK